MTVKELKEIMECLIEDGKGDYIVLVDDLSDKYVIYVDDENKEVLL